MLFVCTTGSFTYNICNDTVINVITSPFLPFAQIHIILLLVGRRNIFRSRLIVIISIEPESLYQLFPNANTAGLSTCWILVLSNLVSPIYRWGWQFFKENTFRALFDDVVKLRSTIKLIGRFFNTKILHNKFGHALSWYQFL